MPINQDTKEAGITWNSSDNANFQQGVKRIYKLICFPNGHFTANEVETLKAMARRMNEIADEFEEDLEHYPLVGRSMVNVPEVTPDRSQGIWPEMGVRPTGEINRSRLWDGTAYLSELHSESD